MMLKITCDVMINGRIRRSKPCAELLSGLVHCGGVSALMFEKGRMRGITDIFAGLCLC
jgi:hypothetical protein